jgi:hypothetical protein
MNKIIFTGKDASILALLAQCSESNLDIFSLLDDLSCNSARKIGKAIIDRNSTNKEAQAFLEWVNSL